MQELEELKDQKNKITASNFLESEQSLYKTWDYRCLVPYSDKDPTKWKTYEMHEFRRAFNEETLKKVDKFKYDNNMFNWVDPKVLKYFTKSKTSLKKAWKKTYGFPYATPIPKMSPQEKPLNLTKCFLKCAQYVSRGERERLFGSREREGKLKIPFPFYGKGTGIRKCYGKGREWEI